MGAVYSIRNNVTKRIYIGKDKDDSAETRCKDHVSGSRFHCLSLRKDMALYGLDNFPCRVIEKGLFGEELQTAELWWIHVFNAADPRFGYNTIGRVHLPNDEAIKQYQADLLKSDPRRSRIYRRLVDNMDTNEIVSIPSDSTFAKNEASSVENDARFIAECKAKRLRLATKADIGAKVTYVWKTYSNDEHTGTLISFGSTWAKIVNDKPEIRAKWSKDEIEVERGVIFVIK